jgi:hypothetical protein
MNQLILKDSLGTLPYLYLGIAYLEKGDLNKAIENFKIVSDSKNPSFQYDAKWYMALTFLKANNGEKAGLTLKELSEKTGSNPHQEAAKKILDNLGE